MEKTIDQKGFFNNLLPALFSMDEETIRNCLFDYNISATEDEEEFWHIVCSLLYELAVTPDDVKRKAEGWLLQHGFLRYSGGNFYRGGRR